MLIAISVLQHPLLKLFSAFGSESLTLSQPASHVTAYHKHTTAMSLPIRRSTVLVGCHGQWLPACTRSSATANETRPAQPRHSQTYGNALNQGTGLPVTSSSCLPETKWRGSNGHKVTPKTDTVEERLSATTGTGQRGLNPCPNTCRIHEGKRVFPARRMMKECWKRRNDCNRPF